MRIQKSSSNILIKNLRKLLILIFLSMGFILFSQESDKQSIHQAFRDSDSKELSKYFNHTLQLTIPKVNGNYSKVQARSILGDFFETYPAKEITILKEGDIRIGQHFCIIAYKSHVKNFQIYYHFEKRDKLYLIQEIQIREKE